MQQTTAKFNLTNQTQHFGSKHVNTSHTMKQWIFTEIVDKYENISIAGHLKCGKTANR